MDLFVCNVKRNPAQSVYRIDQPRKTDRDKILDIHIQIGVQHTDRLLRAASRISAVALIIFIVAQIHERIPVYRNQPDLLGIEIDRSDHDRVASGVLGQRTRCGVHAEECYITIALHHLELLFADALIDHDLLFRNLQMSHFFRSGHAPQYEQHDRKQYDLSHEKQDSFPLFLRFRLCRHLLFTGSAFS